MLDTLYTKTEVAKCFKLSERTLSNWMKMRRIEYLKIGSSVRFTNEAILNMKEKLAVRAKI